MNTQFNNPFQQAAQTDQTYHIDEHVRTVVKMHTPVIGNDITERIAGLNQYLFAWANGHRYEVKLSGSIAKGTAITGTTDLDLFISLDPSVSTCNTLENVYKTLRNRFQGAGYTVREQNVSLGINHSGLKIDLVPGVKHHILGFDHSLWKRKAQTWTKTNIDGHVKYVKDSGRVFDIKAVKIWRKLRGLDFPSFYLEMSVIEALRGKPLLFSRPSENFIAVMNYLATEFVDKAIKDPSNKSKDISEELTKAEKEKIRDAALLTLQGRWDQALW